MKIAFVLTQSLDSPSGLGRYGPLARELVQLGHQVEVIALHYAWHELQKKQFIDAGVRVKYVGQMHVLKKGPHKLYFNPSRLVFVSLMAIIQLTIAIARSDSNIIHLGKPQPFNVLAARLGRRGRKIYCDCDDYEAETNRFSGRWQKQIVRYFEDSIIRDASGLTVNTEFTRLRYVHLGFPKRKIQYVPNGIERSRFVTQSNTRQLRQKWNINPIKPLIIYIGTLGILSHPVDLLLEAFQKVAHYMPAAQLLLVGGGEDYDLLRQQSHQLGISSQTTFTGRVQPNEIPSYLALATVSVDPVRDDLIAHARSPLKVLESLAVGVPVITSDIGDRRLLLGDGECGIMVNAGDSQALAEGLIEIIRNEKTREGMVDATLVHRNKWYWDRLVEDFLQVYRL